MVLWRWRNIGLLFENFVAASVCYVKDVQGKLTAAIKSLDAFCGDQFTDAGVVLARYNILFDVCTSWLGFPFEGDHMKNQRFPEKVQNEVTLPKVDLICEPRVESWL